jgi:hypothetical protein
MISEIIRDKKFQSRAFLLLPMTFNIGVIIGIKCTMFASIAPFADHRLYRRPNTWRSFGRPSRKLPCFIWFDRMVEKVALCTSKHCQLCVSLPFSNDRAAGS